VFSHFTFELKELWITVHTVLKVGRQFAREAAFTELF
jgi:hypothetical protein